MQVITLFRIDFALIIGAEVVITVSFVAIEHCLINCNAGGGVEDALATFTVATFSFVAFETLAN
jgi:hypothetical protein